MAKSSEKKNAEKTALHPRNRHRNRYDLDALRASYPDLAPFVKRNQYGDWSIEFANPAAVKALNTAILIHHYDLKFWDLPNGYLCPPVPGRADYLHYAADLLADESGKVPTGPGVRVLDIGVGANCIYPIIGHKEYGWSFVGADVDEVALKAARQILEANPALQKAVDLRFQPRENRMFWGVLEEGEVFDLSICNPPFHRSAKAAWEATQKKWHNLGTGKGKGGVRNFGGKQHELAYKGGELAFVKQMVKQSVRIPDRIRWFSSLVSKKENLGRIHEAIREVGATDMRTINMSQGQKSSRIVAWTFGGK